MELFRPTGLHEMRLILQNELSAWPPRLPEQPIFYPVLNLPYATQIARDWNTRSEAQAGYVTRFQLDDAYASRFERHVVGGRLHEELWVPAEDLEELNRHLQGPIQVACAFFGARFQGILPSTGGLRGKDAREQLAVLAEQHKYSFQDFHGEVTMNRDAVFLHLPFWEQLDASTLALTTPKDELLATVRRIWTGAFPTLPLPEPAR